MDSKFDNIKMVSKFLIRKICIHNGIVKNMYPQYYFSLKCVRLIFSSLLEIKKKLSRE